ncbi:MAG: hypothetical protein HYX74_00475 [Acidobacteria bacterium]|nr:hypothetical protein [Acidobacteriota bacterium]
MGTAGPCSDGPFAVWHKVKNFHAELLSYGAIPPAIIRDLISQKGLLAR